MPEKVTRNGRRGTAPELGKLAEPELDPDELGDEEIPGQMNVLK